MLIFTIALCAWVTLCLFAVALAAANSGPYQKWATTAEEAAAPAQLCFAGLDAIPESVLPEPATVKPSEARRSQKAKETVFVVDDDPDVLNLLKTVLSSQGFTVRSFTDPNEALSEFESSEQTGGQRADLLVTDFCMQPMNGLDLISRCRSVRPDLKSVVISGYVDQQVMDKFPVRSDRFLHKPFGLNHLLDTVNETLALQNN